MEGATMATSLPVCIAEDIVCGPGHPLLWILGPCVVESRALTLSIADRLGKLAAELSLPLVFKASFDKANPTSAKAYRGLGMQEGLRILKTRKREAGLPVTSDVHECCQVDADAQVCDLVQIPAFLARQTDLLQAAGRTGRAVN